MRFPAQLPSSSSAAGCPLLHVLAPLRFPLDFHLQARLRIPRFHVRCCPSHRALHFVSRPVPSLSCSLAPPDIPHASCPLLLVPWNIVVVAGSRLPAVDVRYMYTEAHARRQRA
ncbi:hypothetical protein OH77DRAFT_1018089 [Trametes cingulata]|nr:hypothetical protein OH77DRAFT_1018089 [Trametes cingulata]